MKTCTSAGSPEISQEDRWPSKNGTEPHHNLILLKSGGMGIKHFGVLFFLFDLVGDEGQYVSS